jgi:hypothetical protein
VSTEPTPEELRIRVLALEEALQPFAEAARDGQNFMSVLGAGGINYADQCMAFVWKASRRLSVSDFRQVLYLMKETK